MGEVIIGSWTSVQAVGENEHDLVGCSARLLLFFCVSSSVSCTHHCFLVQKPQTPTQLFLWWMDFMGLDGILGNNPLMHLSPIIFHLSFSYNLRFLNRLLQLSASWCNYSFMTSNLQFN